MPRIHPTAIVDPKAELADDVVVGPWCLIEGAVKIAARTRLHERVSLQAPLTLGAGNIIHANVCLGREPQDRKYDPAKGVGGVVIGNENQIREGATVHRATGAAPTRVGDRNLLMANCHVAHDAVIGNDCVLANGSLLAGHVVVEDRVILGGNAVVHQFCRIGRLAMISGGSGTVMDIPPFCVSYHLRTVSSLNIVGLRPANYRDHIRPLREAFDLLYRHHHTRPTAAAVIRETLGHDPLCVEFARFLESSLRGIAAYARGGASVDGE